MLLLKRKQPLTQKKRKPTAAEFLIALECAGERGLTGRQWAKQAGVTEESTYAAIAEAIRADRCGPSPYKISSQFIPMPKGSCSLQESLYHLKAPQPDA
jgi:hypothetical protein